MLCVVGGGGLVAAGRLSLSARGDNEGWLTKVFFFWEMTQKTRHGEKDLHRVQK